MSRATRVLLAAVPLTLGATLLAAPAQAASYAVTSTISTTKPDVGTVVTVKGKVTGSSAAGKSLLVQRRVGSGAWTKAARVKATKSGAYSYAYKVTRTGAQSLRVVASATSKTHRGIGPVRPFTGWTWLRLYDESYFSTGSVQRGWVGTVNGGHPPRDTFGLYSSDGADNHGRVAWRTDSLCDRLTAAAGLSDSDGTTRHLVVNSTDYEVVPSEVTTIKQSLTGVGILSIGREVGSGDGYVAVEAPRAHCSVSVLPVAYD